MKVAFTGGGTGGHVLPNIAVIKELQRHKNGKKIEAFYIGQVGFTIEKKLCDENHIPFLGIQAGKLRRYPDFKNLVDIFRLPVGLFQALVILRKMRPDLVFAKGGYVSVPVVVAAYILKIPVLLHESDVTPGLANKICARFAESIFVAFEETRAYFSKEVELVGNPVRAEVLHGSVERGYALTGFSKELPVVIVLGGSMGSTAINKLVFGSHAHLKDLVQVVHVAGQTKKDATNKTRHQKNYISFEYLNKELADVYAIADLVVTRAGSGGIFETLAWNKPMILIPLPKAGSRGDQIENAQVFASHGWAKILDQETLTPKLFEKEVTDFFANSELSLQMIKRQKASGVVFASGGASKIADAIVKKIGSVRRGPS